MALALGLSFPPLKYNPIRDRDRHRHGTRIIAGLGDPFVLELAEKLEESVKSSPSSNKALYTLRQRCAEEVLGRQWPSGKDEAFRFTDVGFLRDCRIEPALELRSSSINVDTRGENTSNRLVIIDGLLSTSLSDTTGLPDGVFVGSLSDLPDNYVLPAPSMEGDLFSYLNGIGTRDLVVVIVPDGCKVGPALHVLYHSHQGGGDSQSVCVSSPRLVVLLGNGAEMDIIEEFGGSADTSYWSNSVLEVSIGDHAKLCHSYIQAQNRHALHFKWTFIQQGTFSSYKLVETSIGGRLSRHNLQIQQLGPDTTTEVSTFHLAGGHQTQDLHSKFILNHPRGYGRQLHKCIVTHSSGHAIFDGNIKVNRFCISFHQEALYFLQISSCCQGNVLNGLVVLYHSLNQRHAQLTDAGQLSRSLLLAPRATVNVKPNLQIVADDVKCSHGAAISDLEEDQLFYFQARGVDVQTARNALVFSFGAEVLERLPYKDLRERVESDVKCLLAAEGAIR